jgi:plastocyanin
MRVFALAVLCVLAGVVRVTSGSPPAGAAWAEAAVDIVDDDFTPGMVSVVVGDTVTWTNTGRKRHDVVGLRGEFRSERLATGERFEFTFTQPGTYHYQCTVHWSMAGTVLVTTSPATASPATVQPPDTSGQSSRPFDPSFVLDGLVERPRTVTPVDLQALPATGVTVEEPAGDHLRRRTYSGVSLFTLLQTAEPQVEPQRPNAHLAYYVRVAGADGAVAVFSWGELDPDIAGATVLVAYAADGQSLGEIDGMVRLVVPNDQDDGRAVRGITSITLLNALDQ